MDLGRLERFIETHPGQNRGEPAGEHRFPRAGRAHHDEIVPPRRRDFERALGVRLSFDLGKVHVVLRALGEQLRHIDRRAREVRPAVEKVRNLGEAARPQHPQAVHDAGLGQVLAW